MAPGRVVGSARAGHRRPRPRADPAGRLIIDFGGERLVLDRGTDWFWSPLALEHVARYRFARRRVSGLTTLDAACGTGYGTALLATTARRVVGVDRSPETIEFARRAWARPNVTFEVGDVTALPMPDATFDAVVSFETIEHVPNPERMVDEVARVLRPGGLLILSTPNRDVYNWADHRHDEGNAFHEREMSIPELRDLLAGRLDIVELYGQLLVPDFGVEPDDGEPAAGARPGRLPGRARSVAVAASRGLLRIPVLADAAFRVARRRYAPVPLDERAWKYVLAVCRLRAR